MSDPVLTDMDRLIAQAQVKLPGASSRGLKGELFDVFTEFFKDSSSWLETIPVSIIAGTTDYTLTPVSGQIIRFSGLLDQNKLPQPATMQTVPVLSLGQVPGGSATWNAVVVKNVCLPLLDTHLPELPDFVLKLYSNTILEGLLGKMMGQMAKSYSNDAQSVYNLKRFRDGIAMARVATLRANSFGTQAWGFPQQYRTRSQKSGVSVGNVMGF